MKWIICVVLAVCVCGWSQEKAVSKDGASSMNKDAQVEAGTPGGDQMLEVAFDRFLKSRKLAGFGVPDAKGRTYVTGKAVVLKNSASPDFIKSRAMAYERAYQDAVANLVMSIAGREAIKSIRVSNNDASDDVYAPMGNFENVQKALDAQVASVDEKVLDAKLKEQGVDPKKCNIVKKKNLYKNAIFKESVKKAFGLASGFLPVQTYESRTADGTYAIGVILRADAVCTTIAQCLATKQAPIVSGVVGMKLDQMMPADDKLLYQFGVRMYFDEQGLPVLLAFGQYGTSYTGTNEARRQQAMEHAMMQAESLADQQMTAFVNSTIAVTTLAQQGEESSEDRFTAADGTVTSESFTKSIDRLLHASVMKGEDTLAGRSTVMRKTLRHPSGHQVALVVRRWSFAQLAQTQQILNGRKKSPQQAPKKQPVQPVAPGVNEGMIYDF